MQAQVKTKNGKNLKVKALVDSGCIHTGINEQLVKDKRIQTKKIDFSFEVFNADGTKNGEVTKVVPLEVEINGYKETLEAAVTDLDRTDMFLGHDWLVKHNPEVNWKNGTIKFTRCPGNCTMTHKDIWFNSRWTKGARICLSDPYQHLTKISAWVLVSRNIIVTFWPNLADIGRSRGARGEEAALGVEPQLR